MNASFTVNEAFTGRTALLRVDYDKVIALVRRGILPEIAATDAALIRSLDIREQVRVCLNAYDVVRVA